MSIFVKPRKAATVALLRDTVSNRGIEVLLMKRHLRDRFLPGYHVFPGGAVDEHDKPSFPFSGSDLNGMKFETEEDRINYYTHLICAIRETFEEAGILIAENGSGYFTIDDIETHERFSMYRKQVFYGELSLLQIMKSENLVPSFSRIHYLTRWITPPFSPIRYDTRFFVAITPPGQTTYHDGDELISSEWINPGDALMMYRRNKMKLVAPTIKTLEFLAGFSSAQGVTDYLLGEKVSSPAISF